MKPLTKTVAIRRGGLAAQLEANSPTVTNVKTVSTNTVRVTTKKLTKLRKRGLLNDTAPKPKYDRNEAHRAYMRDYMRKRRAKLKEAKE